MNLTLRLSPELEAKLKEFASREGKDPEAFAMETLSDRLAPSDGTPNKRSIESWLAKVEALAARMPAGNPHAEFDRESIYDDRGE